MTMVKRLLAVKIDINTIDDFLKKCYQQFKLEDYKKDFGWIDQIAELKDKKQIDKLNTELIEIIKSDNFDSNKTWMAVPENIEWEDVDRFSYSHKKNDMHLDDISLTTFLGSDKQNITIDKFKKADVYCFRSSTVNIMKQWKAFNCLYCEIQKDNFTYLLTNSKWYKIDTDFQNQVNRDYYELLAKACPIVLPSCANQNEDEYNKAVVNKDSYFCLMDRKIINYGGGYSSIEFCDIFSKGKDIIHIKVYGGSSVLSHLFNQGLVSGELYKADKYFRDKVNEILITDFKLEDTNILDATEYNIIFAVISKVDHDLNIPFFSKVSLRNVKKRLETIGYNVYLLKIPVA